MPLPGAASSRSSAASGAVPLPGLTSALESAADTEWEDAPTRMQPAFIPPEAVPGATTKQAPPSNVHDQAATRKAPAYKPPSVGSSGAVPLPGITAQDVPAQSWEEESTRVAQVPMPSEAFGAPATESSHVDFGSFDSTASGAVPLPGASAVAILSSDSAASRVAAAGLARRRAAAGQRGGLL